MCIVRSSSALFSPRRASTLSGMCYVDRMNWRVDPYVPTPPPGEDELPYDDGEPLESDRHRKQMNVLTETLDVHWANRPDVFVGGNMFLYFSELQTKKNTFRGPDVFVVLNTVRRERKSWVVWQEERTPNVIIELLSPRTEAVDRGEKMRVYGRVLRVPEYYLYEPNSETFEAYRLDLGTSAYVRVDLELDGTCRSPSLGVQLAVREGNYGGLGGRWLRWTDGAGNVLPTEGEAAEREAEAARKTSQAAEQELAATKAEAERLRQVVAAYEARFGTLSR